MILVTGGTGLVGSHLLFHLVNIGKPIRAIYRNQKKLAQVKKVFGYYSTTADALFDKIEWIQADITETPALEKAFKGITQVYHCAADLSFGPQNYEASKQTNVIGTANIVNFCLSAQVKKLCYVSSIATLGENNAKLITEETPWNPEKNKHNIYAITKYNAEMEVWRGTQEGLNAVIVNPGVIFGPGFWERNTGSIFAKIANGFHFYTTGSVGYVDVNDVAHIMIQLMESEIKNDNFIVVSENISYQNLITQMCKLLNTSQTPKPVQKWMLTLFYYFEKVKYLFVKGAPTLSTANIDSSFKKLNYSNQKIKNAIPFTFTPFQKSISVICQQFVTDKKQPQ